MSNYPNIPHTAYIVCMDTHFKDEGIPYTAPLLVFVDREQAQQHCEDLAAKSDFKWSSVSEEWRSEWRRDGDTRMQYSMYITYCRLEPPVSEESEVQP